MADGAQIDLSISQLIEQMGAAARQAFSSLSQADTRTKNQVLLVAASHIRASHSSILDANQQDLQAGAHLSGALRDRLALTPERIEAMATGLEAIAALPDPVGRELAAWTRPNGLEMARVAVPLGVIGVIYESRPNVTADAGALCLKAGNAVILRGGSEAVHTNRAVHACLIKGLEVAGLPAHAIQFIPTQDRTAVGALLAANQWLDIIVPRGGRSLVERVQRDARVPVFGHLEGLCHLYIHAAADDTKAIDLTLNAKMRRPGICGALETLLLDKAKLPLLPALAEALIQAGCELRGDAQARAAVPMAKATEEDWHTEYLAPILSIKVVDGPEEAIAHIAHYGSGHTDAICTEDTATAAQFLARVDSAIVMHNASTQFADGGEFGFGAEIGIATGRIHARGPVGLEQLTSFKYQVRGNGQTRP